MENTCHLLLLLLCVQTGRGLPEVFLQGNKANQVLLHRHKRANSFLEELKLSSLERECLEEICDYEEAREIFSVPEHLEEFWTNYGVEDECKSNPCHHGATCMSSYQSYICICPRGFEGRHCQQEVTEPLDCLYMNGHCEHFCSVTAGSMPYCHCAPGYSLHTDNTSCVPQVPFPCGRVTQNFNPRIVKGTVCPKGECPWQAMLEYEGKYTCGGIVLHTMWILTAAHCVWQSRTSGLRVTVGEHHRMVMEGTEQVRAVAKVVVHPLYNYTSSDSDLALLLLAQPVTFGPYVRPVCLPPQGGTFAARTLGSVRTSVVSGWGRLSQFGPESAVLQRLVVPRVSLQECRSQTSLGVTRNMLCAGFLQGEQDSCQGDSGGPLVTRFRNTWFLSGIVSWGRGCAQSGFYGIYTRVANYIPWINLTMATM